MMNPIQLSVEPSTEPKVTKPLLHSQERLELAQQAGNIGTFEWNIQTNEVVWTKEHETLYGLPTGDLQGDVQLLLDCVHPEDLNNLQEAFTVSAEQGTDLELEYRVIWPDQTTRFLLSKAKVYVDQENRPERMIGVTMDITERKELERRKDEFISIASHELKTPIASLKGYNQILQQYLKKNTDPKLKEYIDKMDGQINRISQLVGSLLDVSKLQENKLELNKECFSIDDLIKELAEDIQQIVDTHTIRLALNCNCEIEADKFRTGQVITNLINNAIKYSPKAHDVVIRSEIKNNYVQVSVEDFGVGITKKYQKLIFNRFFQINTKIRGSFFGLGLGLYISSEIIRRHGGRIWVESVKGKGSTFYFRLPIKAKK